jgi:hypothetical protein
MTASLFWFRGFLFDFPRFAPDRPEPSTPGKAVALISTNFYLPSIDPSHLWHSHSLKPHHIINTSGSGRQRTRTSSDKDSKGETNPLSELSRSSSKEAEQGHISTGLRSAPSSSTFAVLPSLPNAHFQPLSSSLHLARWSGSQRDLRYRSVSEVLRLAVIVGE